MDPRRKSPHDDSRVFSLILVLLFFASSLLLLMVNEDLGPTGAAVADPKGEGDVFDYFYNETLLAEEDEDEGYVVFPEGDGNESNSSDSLHILDESAAPNVFFTGPIASDLDTTDTNVTINVTIGNASDLANFTYNWNGNNFSLYDDDLVLMMNFDEYSRLNDSSKYAGYAFSSDNAHSTSEGRFAEAYEFDGISSYVSIRDSEVLRANYTSLTVSVWINHSGNLQGANELTYLVHRSPSKFEIPSPYTLSLISDRPAFQIRRKNGGARISDSLKTNDSKWHHLVGVWNGTYVFLYVDATLRASDAAETNLSNIAANMSIGSSHFNSTYRPFNGTIDEVRIWNRSLSAEEVSQLYMSNLRKVDESTWEFYINQSKNATDFLDIGSYSYYACAEDSSGNENCSEERSVNITDETAPNVFFTNPASSGSNTDDRSVAINATIGNASDLSSLTYNWKGVDLELYGDGLIFMANFDNVAALGEDSGHALDLSQSSLSDSFDETTSYGYNFDAERGDSFGWAGTVYLNSSDVHSGAYSFSRPSYGLIRWEELFEVEDGVNYNLSGWFKGIGADADKLLFGFEPFDENKTRISSQYVNYLEGTESVLYENCTVGDLSIKVADASNWSTPTSLIYMALDVDTSGDYSDLPNRRLSPRITSYTDKGDYWEVNFTSGISYSYPAGTFVREHSSAGSYIYAAAIGDEIPGVWTGVSGNVSSFSTGRSDTAWWPGTRYARIILLPNYLCSGDCSTVFDDINLTADGEELTVSRKPQYSPGKHGNALLFDGMDDYLDFSNSSDLNADSLLTVSAWILPDFDSENSGLTSVLLRKGRSGEEGYGLQLHPSNGLGFFAYQNESHYSQCWDANTDFEQGSWYHITGTANGTALKLYVNGIFKNQSTYNGTIDSGERNLTVGAVVSENTRRLFFDGMVDEVRIWNRSFSSDEIQQLYMSNLRKTDESTWAFYSNQTKNATTELNTGTYSYYACAEDISGNENCSEERSVAILGGNADSSGCSKKWSCGPWGECSNAMQERECTCSCEEESDCHGNNSETRPCSCSSNGDCDDGNECTEDLCLSGTCLNSPKDGASCDDGNECTENDLCVGGNCVGTNVCEGENASASATCDSAWSCGPWSGCIDGKRQRDCLCDCVDAACDGDGKETIACDPSDLPELLIDITVDIEGGLAELSVRDDFGKAIPAEVFLTYPGGRMEILGGSSNYLIDYVPGMQIRARREGYEEAELKVAERGNFLGDSANIVRDSFEAIVSFFTGSPGFATMYLASGIILTFLLVSYMRRRRRRMDYF